LFPLPFPLPFPLLLVTENDCEPDVWFPTLSVTVTPTEYCPVELREHCQLEMLPGCGQPAGTEFQS